MQLLFKRFVRAEYHLVWQSLSSESTLLEQNLDWYHWNHATILKPKWLL